ncbi:hypothetical protein PTNB73_04860 [Pyrenophora teres f. teres]|uniref:FabG n=1 Tax=Pyrenophora teres f. teres TaxID=97479 RepID=A0A6S6W1B9_9PLEO|nr:hypothetical protein HRS9139_05578 [Pyrenophora teres f. teres]KAE8849390.1 hypothetical protein HRS9122_03406 [Pyrenophora teres f. teres]KAE8866766.1 hypothetical protein PTNB73_04860 [Pyrenophora teres f. teres]CAE7033409.1 FabG [Pyrenophora teres f. teres]
MFSLKGKNAAITGAGGAIGTQIAISFAEAGASTILLSDISKEALDRLQKLLDSKPSCSATCFLYQVCDVSIDEQVAELVAKLDEHGGLDIMVNNAGVFPTDLDGDAVTVTARAWELTHNINVLGTWLGCKHAILSMRRFRKQSGSVINLSSVAGLIGSATSQLAYTASKGAVIAMTRELGIVHAREGFRFNSLCPGPLDSPMLQDFLEGEDDSKGSSATVSEPAKGQTSRRLRREVHLPQGRWGAPLEVAGAAVFLASDASSFVNSTELVVDGGLTKAFVTPEGEPHHSILSKPRPGTNSNL